jgi:hypothetical protein
MPVVLFAIHGVSWGPHPDVMLILYKGLIRSVLEYGCIAFDRMAGTHMSSAVLFKYGSKGEAGTGFGVYQLNGSEISYCLREPSGVFTSELLAIFMALVQIGNHHPGEFIILSDSISSLRALWTRKISLRTHSLVYELEKPVGGWRGMGIGFILYGFRLMCV